MVEMENQFIEIFTAFGLLTLIFGFVINSRIKLSDMEKNLIIALTKETKEWYKSLDESNKLLYKELFNVSQQLSNVPSTISSIQNQQAEMLGALNTMTRKQ